MAGENGEQATLETTPTWAVATVCFILIILSIFIEHGFHLLAKYFNKKRRKALIKALDKIKSEIMLFGFITLLLTVCEKYIANICIPRSTGENFLPCGSMSSETEEESKCEQQGKISLISRAGVQELQLLIFAIALNHVLSCFLTFSLGMAKMKRWGTWEAETRTFEYQFSNGNETINWDAQNGKVGLSFWDGGSIWCKRLFTYDLINHVDPRRFQLIHQTSFGRRHLKFWSEHRFLRAPACFIRQFYKSVDKVDYITLRHGFIMAHFAEGSIFDFQKYLKRGLEKDFGLVVRVSPWIWLFSVLSIFFNAQVFYSHFWLPFVPLMMLLVVGTKLQSIITKMCLDSTDKSLVVRGTLLVRPSDHFFWFGNPKILLHLMHFILVQNSFQLAFFSWTWYKFGLRSCFHQKTVDIVISIVTGVVVHVLCGYVTLPLYALVTQMGTSMKKSVFPEGVVDGLKQWQRKAKKNLATRNNNYMARPSLDTSLETSVNSSPSFSTRGGVVFPRELDNHSEDGFVEVNLVNENDNVASKQFERRQKLGSFEGFDVRNVHQ